MTFEVLRRYFGSLRKFRTKLELELIQNGIVELPNQLQGGIGSLETKRKCYGGIEYLKIGFLASKENELETVFGTAKIQLEWLNGQKMAAKDFWQVKGA